MSSIDRSGHGFGTRWGRTPIALVALVALVVASCSTSATVEPTGAASATSVGPAATATPQPPEPTAPPVDRPTTEPTRGPLTEPTVFAQADALLGLSPDGRFAYTGARSPWNDDVPCDGEPSESLVGIEVERTLNASGEAIPFPANFRQVGAIRELVFSPGGRLVIVSSCGSGSNTPSDESVWFQTAELDPVTGALALVGERIDLEIGADGFAPFVRGWQGEDLIETELYYQTDPDDFDSAVVERQLISPDTGEVVSVETVPADDPGGAERRGSYTTPDGRFTYTDIADPGGAFGCEGIGPARTFEVDDGTGPRLALGDDGVTFSYLLDVQFGVDDLMMWSSGCEGFTTAYVGRVADDGLIIDAHWIDTYALTVDEETDVFIEFQYYRLDEQGRLIGLGVTYDDDDGTVRLAAFDLANDPNFVTSSGVDLDIDEASPLAPTLAGPGSWFVGDTLSSAPACGAKTLYGETSTGFARGLSAGTEIDSIVDIDVSEARTQVFDDGENSYTGRTIVVSTECPDEYEGRRLWFGEESGRVREGLFLEQADLGDLGEVAEVLSVREALDPDGGFPEALFAEVRLLDGTVTEIELVAKANG